MRIIDLQLSLPAILLALVLVGASGAGPGAARHALAAAQYAYFARTTHGAASAERRKDYIEAALATPLPAPAAVSPSPAECAAAADRRRDGAGRQRHRARGDAVVPRPRPADDEPSLGMLIANGFQYLLSGRYWITIYPGIALVITIAAINLVGDHIRDVLNPRRRR